MNITVLAGGVSTERDVSLVSGREVYKALKRNGHKVVLVDVFLGYEGDVDHIFDLDIDWTEHISGIQESAPDISKVKELRKDKSNVLFGPNVLDICGKSDIVFMALHGDCGENGKIQATFDLLDIKYTGTDYASSAIAMDKAVTKSIFLQSGVTTPSGFTIFQGDEIIRPSEYPCVVKACNGGSSIGVYFVDDDSQYDDAVEKAFGYDKKILVEQFVKGKEYTCCVIEGSALPVVSIEPVNGHYDYKNKYQAGSTIEICPANISEELTEKIQQEAVRAFLALGIHTYARMDFIHDESNGKVYCLEANTLPGMTPTSLIPQEANAIGKSYDELCDWIIDISMKKYV